MTVSRSDIEVAHKLTRGHLRETPLLATSRGTFGVDHPLTLKLELLQHAGSFKPRGVFNNLLSRKPPEAGVVAASGGNHGAAVAYAAGKLGIKARIFVPKVASPAKIETIRGFGAEVTVSGEIYPEALALAKAYEAETGAMAVHAYDSAETVAGQGTLAAEWEEQSPNLDTLVVAVGGGGLIGGIAAWHEGRVKIVAVEPERCRTLHAALEAGRPLDVPVAGVAVDSLGATRIGDISFAIAQALIPKVVLVSDEAIGDAQRRLWRETRIAAEPGGATALAALISGAYRPGSGERVGILVCGGNVGLPELNRIAALA
jgi:threonine dehydratase